MISSNCFTNTFKVSKKSNVYCNNKKSSTYCNPYNIVSNKWSDLPYPSNYCNKYGTFTSLGECPSGGSYPLTYFKKNSNNNFTDLKGNILSFDIKTPETSDDFFGAQLNTVLEYDKNLTEEQKTIASYWGYGIVENQMLPICQTLLNTYGVNVINATKLYKILFEALNDTMIICWHFKYSYQIPRPIQYKPDFTPYLQTPSHPSYPAGHSVSAGCWEVILSYFFPTEKDKLKALADECGISRIYAGVHYPLDNTEGLKLGRDIANKILDEIKNQEDNFSANINIIYTTDKNAPIYPLDYTQRCI